MFHYDKLRPLTNAGQYLKPGITFGQPDDIAVQHSNNEAA